MSDEDSDQRGRFGFAWDIAMALRQVPLYLGRNRRMSLDDKQSLARQILDHLERAGVCLSRKPPLHGHGQAPHRDREGE